MRAQPIFFRGLAVALLLTLVGARFLVAGESPAESLDRLTDWGAESPAVHEFKPVRHLAGDDYLRRKREILRGLDRARLAASIDSLFSYGITKLYPGTVAKSQGVAIGDQILGIGPHRSDPAFPFRFNALRDREGGEQQILLERFPGKLTSYAVKPGRWGVGLGEVSCRLAAIYLGDEAQGLAWDDDMLVACLAVHGDPDLAETALAHGLETGYHGPIGMAVAATIARHRFQHEAAVDWGLKAIEGMRPEHAIGVAWQSAASGLACGRFASACRLIERFKMQDWFPRVDDFAVTAQALRETYRQIRSPVAVAGQRGFIDLRPFVHPLAPFALHEVEAITEGKPFSVSSGPNRYQPRSWSPRVGNFSLSVRMTFDKPATGLEQDGLMVIGMSSWPSASKDAPYLKVRILRSGIIKLAFNEFVDLYLGRIPSIERLESTTIQISVIDRLAEVTANGTRIYLGPIQFSPVSDDQAPLTQSWDMSVNAAKATFQVLAWEALAPPTGADGAPAQRKAPTSLAAELEQTGRRDEALALLDQVSPFHDPVIHRAIGDMHMRALAFDPAAHAYRHWAEGSRDPHAWLLWADARLKAVPSAAAEVAATLGEQVSSTTAWAHSKAINHVGIALRHGGQQEACLRFLLPLQESGNAGPLYQLFSTQVLVGDWRGARKTASTLLAQRVLRINFEIHARLVDSVLAIRLGEKPPELNSVSDLAQKDEVLPHLALGFAYLGGEITEAEAETRSLTLPSGTRWQYYRGLKALGVGDFATAKNDFSAMKEQFPHEMEGIAAKDFLIWFERTNSESSSVALRTWPYTSPDYPLTPIPVDPPKPGANDF